MSFTNRLQCETGMVVHHNNDDSKIGQSLLLNKFSFTVEINDVIRNHALIDLLFYLEFNSKPFGLTYNIW